MSYIVAFAGQYRSGKDSASDHLHTKLDKWKRGSLGLGVKKIFAEHFGVTLDFIEEWKVKKEIPEGFSGMIRDGLTMIGDGWRNLKQDIWLKKLLENNEDNLIISDCRYINEARAFQGKDKYPYMKDYQGVTCLLWRPGFENDKPSRSEQELMPFVRKLEKVPCGPINDPEIPFDLWLKNDGSKEDWLAKIDSIVLPFVTEKFKL